MVMSLPGAVGDWLMRRPGCYGDDLTWACEQMAEEEAGCYGDELTWGCE